MGSICQASWVASNDGDISCMLSQSTHVYLSNNRCHRLHVSSFRFNENVGGSETRETFHSLFFGANSQDRLPNRRSETEVEMYTPEDRLPALNN